MTIEAKYREQAAVAANALRAALIAVEDCGADPALTSIVIHLSDDRTKLCNLFNLDSAQACQWEKIDRVPSHTSPPGPGEPAYIRINRAWYRITPGHFRGAHVRSMAQPPIPADHDLYVVVPGDEDRKVADGDLVSLTTSGHRFFSAPKYINAGAGGIPMTEKEIPDGR